MKILEGILYINNEPYTRGVVFVSSWGITCLSVLFGVGAVRSFGRIGDLRCRVYKV